MDIFWIFISCIMVLGLSKKTDAGCAQDLQSDQQFQMCVMGYGMFIDNAVEKMDPDDPNAMMNLMCSTEGKQKSACVLTAVDTCPDLLTTGNYASMLKSLQTVKQMGGFEGMCSILQGVAVVRNTEAGCKDDLMAANKACFDSYNTYLANLGQSGADPTQIMVKLCTDEGKAAWSCLKPLLDKCQELKGDARYQVFSILETSGGCEIMNPSGGGGMTGGSGGGVMTGGSGFVCMAAQQECMSMNENEEEADESVVNAPTQFSKFQEEIKTICGQVKKQFECMKGYEKECPNMETQFKKMFDMQRNQEKTMNPNNPFPSFESQKDFVMNQCPKFPDDFSTNACLTDNLKTDEFIDCYNKSTGGSDTKLTCNQYKTAYDCVGVALKTCGDKHKNSYTATMNFYLDALFDDCKVQMKNYDTSRARVYILSFFTMFTSVFLAVFV